MKVADLLSEVAVPDDAAPEFRQLLDQELDVFTNWGRAEQLLRDAQQAMPDQLEIGVALYKMYAYADRFTEAADQIGVVLRKAAERIGCDADWRNIAPDAACFAQVSGPARLYLYSLKAAGFVFLRQGEIESALEVLAKLEQLDPTDEVGGSVVREIANSVADLEAAHDIH
ncbi:hypothetical protein LOC68_19305 [Blastopirellula sp. JC732]|uniref:Tetratricopeptide repeat protein n=1 Tax=Blastopirellula sediminis TaxID=2894196 RepID=A0A9X1MPQ1_9BACT|nr:hypothetical protein [Blastopirellula sediminis]MCC9606152.1 hypothetical protein [Blastopirellula sediminis]MCC9630549.1 hypothetical protein [Blastopirellula sediminis]